MSKRNDIGTEKRTVHNHNIWRIRIQPAHELVLLGNVCSEETSVTLVLSIISKAAPLTR